MDIAEHHLAGRTVFTLTGRFDAHEADTVKDVLLAEIESGNTNLGVNLAAVNFLDSSALATLTSGMKRCREARGDLVLLSPSDPVRVILELTRLNLAFEIH